MIQMLLTVLALASSGGPPCQTIRISEDRVSGARTYEKYVCWGPESAPQPSLGRVRFQ